MEFHISRKARDLYHLDQTLFALDGNILLVNFQEARAFAQVMNLVRDAASHPERSVSASQINAMGLIDEIFHYVFNLYKEQVDPEIVTRALDLIEKDMGIARVDNLLLSFIQDFPPTSVYQGQLVEEGYLKSSTNGIPNRIIALEEMILLWISNRNPALDQFSDLFSELDLAKRTKYRQAIRLLTSFFRSQKNFGPGNKDLLRLLLTPSHKVPDSLAGQLEYIRQNWADFLGEYLARLIGSLDFLKEEGHTAPGGAGPSLIPLFASTESEPEHFSVDREWMPRLVLIAKNTFVWLNQLSKKYGRSIQRLDHIPDEELELLARQGFTGLWLIGFWERSQASAKIKQLCGNPDAISSAYSLSSYSVAGELGGEEAYQDLRKRAWQRGIRLASDMVPNHMGIDSPWVIEHPDWFLQLDYCPYPSHAFNGVNLSSDPRVSIYLEDHYYDRSDAAMEFKRVENRTGETRFIYHGNDGTNMPWNDTAQLNYLDPRVREAVIRTIIAVARKFPIIRFDAAMTLAKKHYQRLWFPEPGTGGAIPTRSDFSMTREQFDQLMPKEFWREVVDRVKQEAPDTLLLAEAFWLMEGFFVRTLGMHRVYNSAFMNMLRDEENANYRQVMKNTLEFDPEILKRYVNFMNNPDELTAVEQFGKGDKYFGICTLMITMPGLPMFGHGQIEGFSEKYGMEFRKPMLDENIDPQLLERHERQIFLLLHRRAHFADVANFLLYDLYAGKYVNEDVFVFSNRGNGETSLIAYNNALDHVQGWINISSAYAKKGKNNYRRLVQSTLAKGLDLHPKSGEYVIFQEQNSGLEYIRSTQDLIEKGLFLEMQGYQTLVFLGFQQVHDDPSQTYSKLCQSLNGRGVSSIQEVISVLRLAPVLTPFQKIFDREYFTHLKENRISIRKATVSSRVSTEARKKMESFLAGIAQIMPDTINRGEVEQEFRLEFNFILSLQDLAKKYPFPQSKTYSQITQTITSDLSIDEKRWWILISWLFLHNIGKLKKTRDYRTKSLSMMEELNLDRFIKRTNQELGMDERSSLHSLETLRALITLQGWFKPGLELNLKATVESWLVDDNVKRFLKINRHEDILWYDKQAFNDLIWWLRVLALIQSHSPTGFDANTVAEQAILVEEFIRRLSKAEKGSGCHVKNFLSAL